MPLSETKIEEVDEGNQQMSSIDSGMYYSKYTVYVTSLNFHHKYLYNSKGFYKV